MSIYTVSEGAKLECSLGTQKSELKVPVFHGATIQGRNSANIADYIPYQNVFPFGMCKRCIPPVPCTPSVVMKWVKGQPDCTLDNDLTLLEICVVPCILGGIIKISDCGQKG